MIAIAHFVAISCYIGAAALAAVPFARPVAAPVNGVLGLLAAGVAAHTVALIDFALRSSSVPVTGLGPPCRLPAPPSRSRSSLLKHSRGT